MSGLSSWGTFGWRLIGNFDYVLTNEDVHILEHTQLAYALMCTNHAYGKSWQ